MESKEKHGWPEGVDSLYVRPTVRKPRTSQISEQGFFGGP